MNIIFRNPYGAVCYVKDSLNPECRLQLIVDTIGVFMSIADLEYLLSVVINTRKSNSCKDCGDAFDKISCKNELIDLHFKVDNGRLKLFEELIKGTLFNIKMDDTLEANKINVRQ